MRADCSRDGCSNGGALYAEAVAAAKHSLQHPETLPSARVLASVTNDYDKSFVGFIRANREDARGAARIAVHERSTNALRADDHHVGRGAKEIEANDTMPFEIYRQQYVSAARLNV